MFSLLSATLGALAAEAFLTGHQNEIDAFTSEFSASTASLVAQLNTTLVGLASAAIATATLFGSIASQAPLPNTSYTDFLAFASSQLSLCNARAIVRCPALEKALAPFNRGSESIPPLRSPTTRSFCRRRGRSGKRMLRQTAPSRLRASPQYPPRKQ